MGRIALPTRFLMRTRNFVEVYLDYGLVRLRRRTRCTTASNRAHRAATSATELFGCVVKSAPEKPSRSLRGPAIVDFNQVDPSAVEVSFVFT